jgi:hypothetical protein
MSDEEDLANVMGDLMDTIDRNTRLTDALIEIVNVRTDVLDSDARDQDWRLVARKMESIARRALGRPNA